MAQCVKKMSKGKRCRAQALTGRKTCLFHTGKRGRSYNPGTSVVRAGPSVPGKKRRK